MKEGFITLFYLRGPEFGNTSVEISSGMHIIYCTVFIQILRTKHAKSASPFADSLLKVLLFT